MAADAGIYSEYLYQGFQQGSHVRRQNGNHGKGVAAKSASVPVGSHHLSQLRKRNQPITHIGWIQTQYFRIPIFPKQEIVTAYITDCYDQNECRTVTAKVVQNKTKTKIALMNKSGESWRINNETVAPGERVLIQKGIRIQIKNEYMEIK